MKKSLSVTIRHCEEDNEFKGETIMEFAQETTQDDDEE